MDLLEGSMADHRGSTVGHSRDSTAGHHHHLTADHHGSTVGHSRDSTAVRHHDATADHNDPIADRHHHPTPDPGRWTRRLRTPACPSTAA